MTEAADSGVVEGLVYCGPFHDPAVTRLYTPSVDFAEDMNYFNRYTPRVVRMPFLSVPIEENHINARHVLLGKALQVVDETLKCQNTLVRSRTPFTIIDGTNWIDVTPSKTWGIDILYINVMWKNDLPVVHVAIGARMWVKNAKHWHRHDPNNVTLHHVWQHNPNVPHEMAIAHMLQSIALNNNQQMQHEFGETLRQAVAQTCNPDVEYPVAAAVYLNGHVWHVRRPYRHPHVLHSHEYITDKKNEAVVDSVEHQGFITNHGNFVTRYRAMMMAIDMCMLAEDHRGVHVHVLGSDEKYKAAIAVAKAENKEAIETKMKGIHQLRDSMTTNGYPVASVPLFSEDLW